MLPFILYYLTEEMYGLWSVFQSIAAITALFDVGFSAAFARNINYCWCGATELKKEGAVFSQGSAPNFSLMKQTIVVCRYVFLLLSGIALLCMLGPGTIYIRHICSDIPGWQPLIAWLFYALAVFLNLYYGYFNSFLRGVGAITDANRVAVIARLLQILLTVVLLMCGGGIIGTGVAYLFYGLFLRVLSKQAFLQFHGIGKSLEQITERASRKRIKELFLIVWYNASKGWIVDLSNYLANQACTIISPLFLSLSQTGVYSLAVQLATVLSNIAGTLYTANQPVLQSAFISDEKEQTRRTMSLIVVSYVGIYAVGLAAIIGVGLPVLRLLKPESTPTVLVMLGVGVYQFILKFRNCYTSYFSCTNRIPYVRAFIAASVACVLLALFLLTIGWDVWGLIAAQIVSQLVFNAWYWMIKAHREMELSLMETIALGRDEIKKIVKGFRHRS